MEQLDLYDQYRNRTGQQIVRGDEIPLGFYITVIHLCIFNEEGQLLIQRRYEGKKSFPNLWDISVGGCAQTGETSEDAVRRECFEELGLALPDDDLRPYLTINFDKGFDDIYMVSCSLDLSKLSLQSDEVAEVKWAGEEEVMDLLQEGQFLPYYDHFLKLLFQMRQGMGFFKCNILN